MGSLFSPSKPTPAPVPKQKPVEDDQAMRNAKKKSYASQRARSGRSSTVLTSRENLG